MTSPGKSYIAFFDLDRTIISLNSGSLLVREAYRNGGMSTANLINAIFQSSLYWFNLRETNLIISKMGTWVKGIPHEVIDELAEKVVNKYLINSIRPEIIKEIGIHKEKNASVVILSSAISSICEPVGRHLGADGTICTSMETIDGILTGAPDGNFCFGDEKRIRLLSYCEKNHYDPAEAWYYADSISDLSALEVVGHQVCVTPDKKLKKVALERGWRVF
ncbi:MAG: HAD-IB family hydrolase [Odoribacter sp.]|nr:HAD-IB family hydrolase [Odoribacter sp.]